VSAHAHRFLIVRLGALGDVVHAIPVAAALRQRFPGAQIDWLVDPRYVELVQMVRGVDRAVPIDLRAPLAAWTTVGALRRRRYHAAIDLQGLVKSAALARVAGAVWTIGFAAAHLREPLARKFYTAHVDPGASGHIIRRNLALLEPLGIRSDRLAFPLTVEPTIAADAAIAAVGGPFALINPGAAWPNKRWPAERFGAVARALLEGDGLGSLVLWGPGEERLAEDIVAQANGAATLAPPTAIADIVPLAARARLVISGDTGPLHLAAAVGAPIVGVYGPTDPARNGPWLTNDVCVSRYEACQCHYKRSCTQAARCIDDIAVEAVVAAARRRLSTAA